MSLRWKLEASSAPGRRRPSVHLHEHGGRGRVDPPETRHRDPLLVAVRDLTTTYYGQQVDIRAGRDRVRASHPIAQRHPDAFGATEDISR
jgi:hypothetical protein